MSTDRPVAVVGAGLMGHAIALCFARAGRDVRVTDAVPDALASLPERVDASLAAIGVAGDVRAAALARITTHADLMAALDGVEYVTEAVAERIPVKRDVFARMVAAAPGDAILASNTSVIPITEIAREQADPGRIVGTHWWNPGHLIPLVEVVRTEWTTDDAVARTATLLRGIGKRPAIVQRDVPGFIGNRLQHALWREAISLVENGVCSADDVDLVVTSSFGRRLAVLGPLANADLIGTDLTLDIHRQVLGDLEASPDPSPYLEGLVAEGLLGFATHRGFREWSDASVARLRADLVDHLIRMTEQLDTAAAAE